MRLFFIVLFFYGSSLLAEMPWGKDADLAKPRSSSACVTPPHFNPLAELGVFCIRFHQEVISPADGPRSHFIPSSSQYTLDAMRKYGFFKGVVWGCDRLMRENADPWIYPTTCDGSGKVIKFDSVK